MNPSRVKSRQTHPNLNQKLEVEDIHSCKGAMQYASQYVLLTTKDEQDCYEEAMADECNEKWQSAMQDEIDSLHEIILMTW